MEKSSTTFVWQETMELFMAIHKKIEQQAFCAFKINPLKREQRHKI